MGCLADQQLRERVQNAGGKGGREGLQHQIQAAAVERFAIEMAAFLSADATCLFIPTSKMRGDPEFDPRFDLLQAELKKRRPDLTMIEPIVVKTSTQAAHVADEEDLRDPYKIMENYTWVPEQWNSPELLFVIDDVLASGGHFKAAELFIRANTAKVGMVMGIAWALEI